MQNINLKNKLIMVKLGRCMRQPTKMLLTYVEFCEKEKFLKVEIMTPQAYNKLRASESQL